MKSLLRKILPVWIKKRIRALIKFVKYSYRYHKIKRAVRAGDVIKIIVGAAETYQPGWLSTNEQWLDITKPQDWRKVFQGKRILSHVVAEHVFEHLTYEEAQTALALINEHLIDGGRVRIAVPDGFNPDETYLKHVGINGIGDDAADHKQLLNAEILEELIRQAGFEAAHLEGYRQDGMLVQIPYKQEDGFILRSRANADMQDSSLWDFPDADTSLIVDGLKARAA